MNLQECRPYHATLEAFHRLEMPDGRSRFKIYYLNQVGRPQRERYEWPFSALTPAQFEADVRASGMEGIGFITAFPYVAKIFRFSPYAETVLDFREYQTAGLIPKEITRPDGTREFACYAETLLAAQEYQAWAQAASVEEYLTYRCDLNDFPVNSHTKLARYYPRPH